DSARSKLEIIRSSLRLRPGTGGNPGFEVVVTKDLTFLSREGLLPYDAVVFFTTGELPISDDDRRHFVEWLRSGKGFVGIHSATDTFYEWPEYGEIIGGYFDGHPWHQEVAVRV